MRTLLALSAVLILIAAPRSYADDVDYNDPAFAPTGDMAAVASVPRANLDTAPSSAAPCNCNFATDVARDFNTTPGSTGSTTKASDAVR